MSNVISTRVSDEVFAMVDRLANEQERSRAWIIQRLVEEGVKREVAFLDFLKEGEDAFERGDYISHEQLIENLKARYERKQAA